MRASIVLAVVLGGTALASAAEIGVVSTKLIIFDKTAFVGLSGAKVIYVSKDTNVTKGTANNTSSIEASFNYGYDAAAGRVFMQAGGKDPGDYVGWAVNSPTVAKFINKIIFGGSTVVRVAIIKPGKLLKVTAKGFGDPPNVIDIVTAGPPIGDVHTAFTVDNLGEVNSMCSTFSACIYKVIAGDTGAKLVCKDGAPDPTCAALGSPSGAFLD